MYDRFFAEHPHIRLDNRHMELFRRAFERAEKLCLAHIHTPNIESLGNQLNSEAIHLFYLMHAKMQMDLFGKMPHIERFFLEIVLLHRWQITFDNQMETDSDKTVIHKVILGNMIQHRWTLLILDLYERQLETLFAFGDHPNLNTQEWQTAFIGAATVSRMITMLEQTGCQIFLPTLFEDVHLGVDLIVILMGTTGVTFSIKSGVPHMSMLLESVSFDTPLEDDSPAGVERSRLASGTRSMNNRYQMDLNPCRVKLSRDNGLPYSIKMFPEDVDRIRSLFSEIIQPPLNTIPI